MVSTETGQAQAQPDSLAPHERKLTNPRKLAMMRVDECEPGRHCFRQAGPARATAGPRRVEDRLIRNRGALSGGWSPGRCSHLARVERMAPLRPALEGLGNWRARDRPVRASRP